MKTITIETVLSVFKNYSDKKRIREIKDAVVKIMLEVEGEEGANPSEIELQVESIIKEDRRLGDSSELVYSNGKYSKRKKKKIGADPIQRTEYVGRAGECAVMSELIFRGYNANRMMIDEGVDIIAVKDNLYYYIQVKTTYMKNERVYCHIDFDRFNQYIGAQIRYFIVVRYKDTKGDERNMFFQFDNTKIQDAIYQRCVKRGEQGVYVKIKFNEKTGSPSLYDEKEMDVSYNMNRFEL